MQSSPAHISVVGPRSIGKTELLKAVVERHRSDPEVFDAAVIVDLRHDLPSSAEEALDRIGMAIREAVANAKGGVYKDWAAEIKADDSPGILYDTLKSVIEMFSEAHVRLLLVLDGCDALLQNSSISRNLWDNLRALAQFSSLRLMTGSRAPLQKLCYNPEARTSDFWGIFNDEPIQVGPFGDEDWEQVFSGCGLSLDGAARKEFASWTGGHPDLVGLLLDRLQRSGGTSFGKQEVDASAESILASGSARVDALWMDCSEEARGDVMRLASGELLATDLPLDRLRFLIDRGIAARSGNRVRLSNGFLKKHAATRERDVSGTRRLFESTEDFHVNIRSVIELRLAQVQGADPQIIRCIRRSVLHLPDDPAGTLGCARDILDRALDLVWAAEAPGGRVPQAWIEDWKFSGRTREVEEYTRTPTLPEARGRQCGLLRLATGQQYVKPSTRRISKSSYVLIEHMNQIGDLKNHTTTEPSLTMAVAFCFAAIELAESLGRDLS